MGTAVIEKLNLFVKNYPFVRMHKILATLILTLLKMRAKPEYPLECLLLTKEMKPRIQKQLSKHEIGDKSRFDADLNGVFQESISFPLLSPEESVAIFKICQKLLPESRDSLEMFLATKFFSLFFVPNPPNYFQGKELLYSQAVCEATIGVYVEIFILRTIKEILENVFEDAVISFYTDKGYSLSRREANCIMMVKRKNRLEISYFFENHYIRVLVDDA